MSNVPVEISVTGGLAPPFFVLYYQGNQGGNPMPRFVLSAIDEDETKTTKTFEADYLDDVVDKVQDFLHGVGFVFEELHTQVYAIPETNDDDDYRSIYKDVD